MIDLLSLVAIATVGLALWLWFGKKDDSSSKKGENEEKIYVPSYTKKSLYQVTIAVNLEEERTLENIVKAGNVDRFINSIHTEA